MSGTVFYHLAGFGEITDGTEYGNTQGESDDEGSHATAAEKIFFRVGLFARVVQAYS